MKLLVINNLSSGYRDGAIYDFVRLVSEDGDEVCLRSTDGSTPIEGLLADAEGFDAVVASGGDGTIAAVAHALAYTKVPILPFPAGTANLLANNLLAPFEAPALAKMVRNPRYLDFDLGEIITQGRRYGFSIMAGAGYDATIMAGAKSGKKRFGQMAYFQAAFANPTPQVSKITLDIDGKTIEREGLGVVLVNFSQIQFDITVTHENAPRDGMFDVMILEGENAYSLIPALIAGIRDIDGGHPGRTDSVEVLRGRNVAFTADPPFNVQYDGETPPATTPVEAHVLPGAARFIVSEAGWNRFATDAPQGK